MNLFRVRDELDRLPETRHALHNLPGEVASPANRLVAPLSSLAEYKKLPITLSRYPTLMREAEAHGASAAPRPFAQSAAPNPLAPQPKQGLLDDQYWSDNEDASESPKLTEAWSSSEFDQCLARHGWLGSLQTPRGHIEICSSGDALSTIGPGSLHTFEVATGTIPARDSAGTVHSATAKRGRTATMTIDTATGQISVDEPGEDIWLAGSLRIGPILGAERLEIACYPCRSRGHAFRRAKCRQEEPIPCRSRDGSTRPFDLHRVARRRCGGACRALADHAVSQFRPGAFGLSGIRSASRVRGRPNHLYGRKGVRRQRPSLEIRNSAARSNDTCARFWAVRPFIEAGKTIAVG